jgi:hypothetical protein
MAASTRAGRGLNQDRAPPFDAGMLLPTLLVPLLAASAAAFGPQEPNRPPPALVLRLVDQASKPIAGLPVTLQARTTGELPALANVPPFASARALAPTTTITGTSDAGGIVRFEAPDAAAAWLDAAGLVTTPRGLGALVADLHPGRAQRIDLLPMGALGTATGSEELLVHARALLPNGRALILPPVRGTRVQLPAGDYELWIRSDDGWLWQRTKLVSGELVPLDFTAPARVLQCAPGTWLHPDGRADVPLCTDGGDVVLRGAAANAALWAWRAQRASGPHVVPPTSDGKPLPWPPIAAERPAELGALAPMRADGPLLLALRRLGNQWQPLWVQADDDAAWRALGPPPSGEHWLLRVAAKGAPACWVWPAAPTPHPTTNPGVALQAHVRTPDGLPAADVACEFEPDGMPAAAVRARSDGRGVVAFGPVLAPGTLRIVDPQFVNRAVELANVPGEPPKLLAEPGAMLRGIARWPDGSPARGVVVTLRDPSGTLRPAERAQASGDDGSFAFGGLPEQRGLLLFAVAIRDGRTWSGRLERTLAGGEVTLTLQDEDPVLGR